MSQAHTFSHLLHRLTSYGPVSHSNQSYPFLCGKVARLFCVEKLMIKNELHGWTDERTGAIFFFYIGEEAYLSWTHS